MAAAARQSAVLAWCGALLAGTSASPPAEVATSPVLTDLEVLVRDSMAALRGPGVGLITNHTGFATINDITVRGVDLQHASTRVQLGYDATGLNWVPPSPDMPSLESATHYPGTCLFEGTSLSVGRGTELAFQQVGAPRLEADSLVARLQARRIPGVRFEAAHFTPRQPGDGKFPDQQVRGIRLVSTDRSAYHPTTAAIALLVEIRALHPDSLQFRAEHFDRLAGTDQVRLQLLAARSAAEITPPWAAQLQRFDAVRRNYLLHQ